MNISKKIGIATVCFAATLVCLSATIDTDTTAAEATGKGDNYATDDLGHNFPPTAIEYAKMVEPILGIPPKIDLGQAVELPIYVDGVQAHGHFDYGKCDNPSRLGKGGQSGSVLQRYEGKTADGKPLPDVVWVAFGRNASYERNGETQYLWLGTVHRLSQKDWRNSILREQRRD